MEGEREGMSSVVGKKVERKKGGGAHEFVVECCAWIERVRSEVKRRQEREEKWGKS